MLSSWVEMGLSHANTAGCLPPARPQEFPERTVVAVPCDVSKHQDVQALVGKAAHELGRIVSRVARAGLPANLAVYRK